VGGGEQGTTCVGKTGSFDLVTTDGVKPIVTGLISGSGEGVSNCSIAPASGMGPQPCRTGGQVARIR
jgi:hypothetical protein